MLVYIFLNGMFLSFEVLHRKKFSFLEFNIAFNIILCKSSLLVISYSILRSIFNWSIMTFFFKSVFNACVQVNFVETVMLVIYRLLVT